MRKLADSKPVHAAAGAGVLASETLRELSGRLANWRPEASVNALSTRANGYVATARTRASNEYDKLAKRGERALHARGNGHAKGALNGKQSHRTQTRSTQTRSAQARSTKA